MKEENELKRVKRPWPTKDAMEQVYAMKLWGGNQSGFYSGDGSHAPSLVDPYLNAVISFLTSFESPLTVCDLGCGDFNIGQELVRHTKEYLGIDIVPDLIARNKVKFKTENLSFNCLDIAMDDLPAADCVIIRQVLQHLSNREVLDVVQKLTKYQYIILTEHIPQGDFEPNKDIISGQGIRLKKQSGVNLLAPPFNLKVKAQKELLSVDLDKGKGRVVTWLYEV